MSIGNGLLPESLQLLMKSYPDQAPFKLTVGFELEFIFIYRKAHELDNDLTSVECITEMLRAFDKPVDVICQSCGGKDRFLLPMNEYYIYDKDKWEIDAEGIFPGEEIETLGNKRRRYGFNGMELKSRILGDEACHQKKCCGKGVTVEEEIQAVLGRLKSSFCRLDEKGKPANHFIYVSSSSGFHVHLRINEPEKSGLWSLATLQKLLALQVACEAQLDSMNAIGRINGFKFDEEKGLREQGLAHHPMVDHHVYNHPISMFLMMDADRKRRRDRNHHGNDLVRVGYEVEKPPASKRVKERPSEHLSIWLARRLTDIDSWITRIRWTQDLEDVTHVTATGKRCVFNTTNIKLNEGVDQQDTVEFRQCRGTLSASQVINYINFIMHMAVFCHLIPEDEFYLLVATQAALRHPGYAVTNLLEQVQCSDATQAYFKDQLDPENDAWSKSLNDELKRLESIKAEDEPLAALACAAVKQELACVDPREVQKLIRHKLTVGGYGHFRQKVLESVSLDAESFKDRESAIERLRLDYIAPINDGSERGSQSGYGYVYSGESDPELEVDKLDLPHRIKGILEDKENGEYSPVLPNGSRAASKVESAVVSRSSSRKLRLKERAGSVDSLASLSGASLSAEEDRPPRKEFKAPVRGGKDGVGRSLPKAQVSESRSGSADSSRGSGSGRPRKVRRPV